MKIQATWQLKKLVDTLPGTVVMVGGTRSGKTYAGLQYWIQRLFNEPNKVLDVARKYRESHRNAALYDFRSIMESMALWDESSFSKSDFEYKLGASRIRFIGMDVDVKKMGAGRDYLWVNEATELSHDEYRHLAMRTRGDTFMFDLNPKAHSSHWVKSDIMQRPGTVTIHSTYKDNPFLTARQIQEIEVIKNQDPDFWRVYGEGQWVSLVGNIYKDWTTSNTFPDVPYCYGLDFGMTDPTALVKCAIDDGVLYWQEMLYRTNMTNSELIRWIKMSEITEPIYSDTEDKNRIVELQNSGIHAVAVDKGKGSVRAGIDFCRQHKIVLVHSPNGEKEISQYRWRENRMKEIVDGEPVDFMNHFLDAGRYAAYNHYTSRITDSSRILVRL